LFSNPKKGLNHIWFGYLQSKKDSFLLIAERLILLAACIMLLLFPQKSCFCIKMLQTNMKKD